MSRRSGIGPLWDGSSPQTSTRRLRKPSFGIKGTPSGWRECAPEPAALLGFPLASESAQYLAQSLGLGWQGQALRHRAGEIRNEDRIGSGSLNSEGKSIGALPQAGKGSHPTGRAAPRVQFGQHAKVQAVVGADDSCASQCPQAGDNDIQIVEPRSLRRNVEFGAQALNQSVRTTPATAQGSQGAQLGGQVEAGQTHIGERGRSGRHQALEWAVHRKICVEDAASERGTGRERNAKSLQESFHVLGRYFLAIELEVDYDVFHRPTRIDWSSRAFQLYLAAARSLQVQGQGKSRSDRNVFRHQVNVFVRLRAGARRQPADGNPPIRNFQFLYRESLQGAC